MSHKTLLIIVVFVLVPGALCKPRETPSDVNGRGFGSTLWGWVTYPLAWWSESESAAPGHRSESIEVARRNVTVWCDEQTCTTRACDAAGCANHTCNIYDTDLTGECRRNTADAAAEEPRPAPTPAPSPTPTTAASVSATHEVEEERPLQLEAALSSSLYGRDEDTQI